MALLMGITTEGSTRIAEQGTDDLRFVVTHIAYGTQGFNPGSPKVALALNAASTALGAEVYRKEVPLEHTTLDLIGNPRGTETTYTSVSGVELSAVLGEAGIIATVTEAGTTGLDVGYQFLMAQAHFPRVVLSVYTRLAIKWPVQYFPP